MNTNANKDDRRFFAKKRWWVRGAALLLLVWVIKLFSGLPHLMGAISGAPAMGVSDSMELYPVKFRTPTSAPDGAYKVAEWQLSLPRAFVVDQFGESGAVRGNPHRNNLFSITGEVVMSKDLSQLLPLAQSSGQDHYQRRVVFVLENKSTIAEVKDGENCIKQDDFGPFMSSKGDNTWERTCPPSFHNCNITTHIDGWSLELAAARPIYNQPEKICATVKSFLNKYTIKRDSLRSNRP